MRLIFTSVLTSSIHVYVYISNFYNHGTFRLLHMLRMETCAIHFDIVDPCPQFDLVTNYEFENVLVS